MRTAVPILPRPKRIPTRIGNIAKVMISHAEDAWSGALDGRPVIRGYEILDHLGTGGMGVVYRACQSRIGRVVAVKVLRGGALADPRLLERFRIEVEAVARLQHPHVVQIYEAGEQDGCAYFSMEYVEGGSLDRKAAGRPQAPRLAADVVKTLSLTMHFAHQRGIVHRDLKPGNVLLTADGTPKIADFGLAKCLQATGRQTQSGEILGTPFYMAPEQAEGQSGPAVDIYALGAILYELLTGRPPFRGPTPMDTLQQVRTQEPVSPSRLQPKVPRDLDTICLKCLQKDPRKRYADADALAEDLRRFLSGEPICARPAGISERVVKWAKRRPTAAALVAVLVLAVSGFVGGLLWHSAQLQRAAERHRQLATAAQRARVTAEKNADQANRLRRQAGVSASEADRQRRRAEDIAEEANRQRRRAEASATEAEKQRQRAEENAAEANRQRQRAIELFAKAHQAAKTLFAVTRGSMARDHDAALMRHEILLETIKTYEQLLDSEDPQIQHEAATVYRNLAYAKGDQGEEDRREEFHQEAVARLMKLVRQHPDTPVYRFDLAQCYIARGNMLWAFARHEEAQQVYGHADSLLAKLAAEFPHESLYQRALAAQKQRLDNLRQDTAQTARLAGSASTAPSARVPAPTRPLLPRLPAVPSRSAQG